MPWPFEHKPDDLAPLWELVAQDLRDGQGPVTLTQIPHPNGGLMYDVRYTSASGGTVEMPVPYHIALLAGTLATRADTAA